MNTLSLSFNDTQLSPIKHNNQIWLTAVELSKALGYADDKSVSRIFTRNKDEFTGSMTTIFEGGQIDHPARQNDVIGESKGLQLGTRLFSLRGCHLIAMFSKTAIAKQFRVWVLDILDKEVVKVQPTALPAPKHITESEALQFRLSMQAHCKGDRVLYKKHYRMVYDHFNITEYLHIPAGKLSEAAKVADIKLIAAKTAKPVQEQIPPLENEMPTALKMQSGKIVTVDNFVDICNQTNISNFAIVKKEDLQKIRDVLDNLLNW